MLLQEASVLDIVKLCSGPEGCSVSVLLQCIAKDGLEVRGLAQPDLNSLAMLQHHSKRAVEIA